jgi:hypothetical protein
VFEVEMELGGVAGGLDGLAAVVVTSAAFAFAIGGEAVLAQADRALLGHFNNNNIFASWLLYTS